MDIKSNKEDIELELIDLVKLFKPSEPFTLTHEEEFENGNVTNRFDITFCGKPPEHFENSYPLDENLSPLKQKSIRKRQVKVELYDIMSKELKTTLPWGSLTGVHPTKFARALVDGGEVKEYLLAETLEKDYRVRSDKARLTTSIIKNQKGIIRNDKLIDLYINIPICPTRCLYCSFISSEYDRVKDKLLPYLKCLMKELDAVKKVVAQRSYIVRTIYIGGGTPTVLSASELDALLSSLTFPVSEFTVECGRPDTITAEKLDVLKKHNVTRISINPQTFCEATLKRIGRKHKNKEVFSSYSMALERGFDVNMDVIAGLPGEKLGAFKRTMQTLLELNPENITVHTLSVKNGSVLKEEGERVSEKEVPKMIDYAQKLLSENGYKPYYIYRQKNQLAGLENVGYYRDEKVCIFNIDSMEETNSVIALGAGAMSKRVFNDRHFIDRQSNCKFIEEYISRIDEIIEKKIKFFE